MKKTLLIILPFVCFVLYASDLMGNKQGKEDRLSSSEINSLLSKSRGLLLNIETDTVRVDSIYFNTMQIEIKALIY